MIGKKLSKETLERFSISYNQARALGITDEDLKYIYEVGEDKFRISIRDGKERITKIVYGLTNAINVKWQMVHEIEMNRLSQGSRNGVDKNKYRQLTVIEGFDLFFSYRKSLVNKGKIERTTYEKDVDIFRGRYIQNCELLNKRIINIHEEEAQDFVDYLYVIEPVLETKTKLSENTLNNPYALIHRLFEYFRLVLKVIKTNPFDSVDQKPRYTPKDRNYLANEDIKYVLSELNKKNIRFKTLINLFLETGLRIEEITPLKYSDINRLRETIKISRALVKSKLNGELIIKDLKTKSSEREITISSYCIDLIDNYRRFKTESGMLIKDDDFIFTSWLENELISPSKYTAEWRVFSRSLGYKDLPLRIMRHSAVTFMLQGETNIKAVKKRFGWSKDSTVMGIYNQSNLEEDKKLLNKFEEEFRNTLGVSYADLYCICVNRFNNKRKLNEVLQAMLGRNVDQNNFESDLKRCQEYLMQLFPVFSKIAKIDHLLDDEEVEAIFVGFKPIYKKIKVELVDVN